MNRRQRRFPRLAPEGLFVLGLEKDLEKLAQDDLMAAHAGSRAPHQGTASRKE
jgi:hypothetical protein